MTYIPPINIIDRFGKVSRLCGYIMCEDEHDNHFKIIYFSRGVKIKQCNTDNQVLIPYYKN